MNHPATDGALYGLSLPIPRPEETLRSFVTPHLIHRLGEPYLENRRLSFFLRPLESCGPFYTKPSALVGSHLVRGNPRRIRDGFCSVTSTTPIPHLIRTGSMTDCLQCYDDAPHRGWIPAPYSDTGQALRRNDGGGGFWTMAVLTSRASIANLPYALEHLLLLGEELHGLNRRSH